MTLYAPLKVSREKRARLKAPQPPRPVTKAIEEYRALKGIKKTHVSLGFQAPSFTNADFYPMVIIESMLYRGRSSILRQRFADRTDIKDISVKNQWSLGTSDFTISFLSDNSNVDSSISLILEELEKLRRIRISKADLNRAKRILKNHYAFQYSGSLVQSYLIGNFETLDEYEFFETSRDMLDAVTTDDILRVAEKYFGLNKYSLLVLYPEGQSPNQSAKLETKIFDNGLTVIVKPSPTGDDTVGLTIGIKGGTYIDPDGKEGLSKLLFSTLEKGSSTNSPDGGVRASIEDLGAVFNGIANQDASALIGMTSIYFLDEYLQLLYDIYENPELSGEDFKRAKAALLDKIEYIKEVPSAHMEDLLYEKLFAGHPFGKPVYGTKDSLSSITPLDLISFHKKYFVPGNTTIVIVGNVSPDAVFRQIERNFGKLPQKDVIVEKIAECPVVSSSKITLLKQRGPISSFSFGFIVPNSFDDFGNFSVIGNICGWGRESLLFKMLTDNGFTVKSLNYNFRLRGQMGVSSFNGELASGDIKALPALVKKLVASISSRKFTQGEIKSTSRKLATALAIQNESKLIQSVSIFWSHNYAPELLFIENLCNLYKTMNHKDVERVAKKHFTNYELIITDNGK
jgi:predicted Zn-dependent peptidase